ncbi:MAG: LpxI family protein [Candidatus Aminicenantes bacterium]
MGNQLGIIAGSGEFPFLVLKEAQKSGYTCVAAGIRGQAGGDLAQKAEVFEWFDAEEILNLISFFRSRGVDEAVFAGKVDHRIIYKIRQSHLPVDLSWKNKTPTSVVKSVIDFLSQKGIEVKDPMSFLSSTLCREGIMTKTEPSQAVKEDIAFGWKIGKNIADLDIGQAVVVKDKAVVAVEGMEGTDEAIRRGSQLAGDGTVVVKVVRSHQDSRIDLPAIGLHTVKSLVEAKSRALCFEARRMPFFQREEAVSLADRHGIVMVAKR